MSKDVQNNEKKPWENQFDNDLDQTGNVSRVATKSKQKGNTLFALLLILGLLLLVAIPIIGHMINEKSNNNAEKISITESRKNSLNNEKEASKSDSLSKKQASEEQAEKEASEKSASESAKQASEEAAKKASEEAAAAASSSVVQSSSSSSVQASSSSTPATNANQTESGSASYYTVKAGEGLYRAAVNSGISLQRLLELNGLNENSTVTPGTRLRIK